MDSGIKIKTLMGLEMMMHCRWGIKKLHRYYWTF